MAREPRWIHERSGETLTVKVGPFYAPAQFRLPAAMELELRSWFRRRRLQGWAVAVLMVLAVIVAATVRTGAAFVLYVAWFAFPFIWPIMSGNRPNPFKHAFPAARLLSQARGANAIARIDYDGAAVVQPSGTFRSYRLNAADTARFLEWRRKMQWQSALFLLPLVSVYLLAERAQLSADQFNAALLGTLLATVAASLLWSGWRFRRDFRAALQVETPASSRFIASLSDQWLWKRTGLVIQGGMLLLLGLMLCQGIQNEGFSLDFGGYFIAA